MKTKYGSFTDASVDDLKVKLHKKLFWLLLYKDPNISQKYEHVDFEKYFVTLMKELNALEQMVINGSGELLEVMAMLQVAYHQTESSDFDYHTYRKFILDAHSLLDRVKFKGGDSHD